MESRRDGKNPIGVKWISFVPGGANPFPDPLPSDKSLGDFRPSLRDLVAVVGCAIRLEGLTNVADKENSTIRKITPAGATRALPKTNSFRLRVDPLRGSCIFFNR